MSATTPAAPPTPHEPYVHLAGWNPAWPTTGTTFTKFDYKRLYRLADYSKSSLPQPPRVPRYTGDALVHACKQPEESPANPLNLFNTLPFANYTFRLLDPDLDGGSPASPDHKLPYPMEAENDYPFADPDDGIIDSKSLTEFASATGDHFSKNNTFFIRSNSSMPQIPIICKTDGFDVPADGIIHWRLAIEHKVCRYFKGNNFLYQPTVLPLTSIWQGRAQAKSFYLFKNDAGAADPNVSIDFEPNDPNLKFGDFVQGGHAILSLATKPAGCPHWLRDHAHLLIGGKNPTLTDLKAFVRNALNLTTPTDPPASLVDYLYFLLVGIFWGESGSRQFNTAYKNNNQTHYNWNISKLHSDPKCKHCKISFEFPGDPPDFPIVGFDYGIGITQYTWTTGQDARPGARLFWNWQENLRKGLHLYLMEKAIPALKDVAHKLSGDARSWKAFAYLSLHYWNGGRPHAIDNNFNAWYAAEVANAESYPNAIKAHSTDAAKGFADKPIFTGSTTLESLITQLKNFAKNFDETDDAPDTLGPTWPPDRGDNYPSPLR
jgi:hypothetical protein